MIELVAKPRTSIKYTFGEESWVIKKPNNGQLMEFQKASSDPLKSAEAVFALLAELGLPLEASRKMEPEDINDLVELLIPKKKQ